MTEPLRAQADDTAFRVHAAIPAGLVCSLGEWRATVEAFRSDMETPEEAAVRLSVYLTACRESYGDTPRLNSIRADGLHNT